MKTRLGARNCLYPMLTVLAGTNVHGQPNYNAMAHIGIMNVGSVSLAMNKVHYTNIGIRENKTFSINIPSVDMVKETDYCGIVSGRNVDKAALFENFYGTLKNAPMIKECPVNMECKLIKTVDFPNHDIFVGEVVETYCDEQYLTDGIVDLAKVQPILFSMGDVGYWELGNRFARAWSIGKTLKNK